MVDWCDHKTKGYFLLMVNVAILKNRRDRDVWHHGEKGKKTEENHPCSVWVV